MQLTPNGVKWITWFLSCCDKCGFQPTLRLFHQLFYLIRSNHLPLYELRFRAAECGYGPGKAKPIIMQSSLKYWNKELIFLKFSDVPYMPHIVMSEETEDFKPPILKGDTLNDVFKFSNSLGFQCTRDTFMNPRTLHTHGCESFVFPQAFLTSIGTFCSLSLCCVRVVRL